MSKQIKPSTNGSTLSDTWLRNRKERMRKMLCSSLKECVKLVKVINVG